MNVRNSYSLIHIGLLVRFINSAEETLEADSILTGISRLTKLLQESDLRVTYSALQALEPVADISAQLGELKGKPIGKELKKLIREEFKDLEKIIFAESRIKKIYVIPQIRYNGDFLLSHPEKLLKDSLFNKLSDISKFDFSSSCRCLAFGEATASAFHILRATEDVLKLFYFKYKKVNRLKKPMWGPMTIELRAKKTNKPSESILYALDVVRNSYRNPTQHPLAKYDIDSAQDLFGVCVDLINKMAVELD